jgi:hypothetical protein
VLDLFKMLEAILFIERAENPEGWNKLIWGKERRQLDALVGYQNPPRMSGILEDYIALN